MNSSKPYIYAVFSVFLLLSCSTEEPYLFNRIEDSGVDFINELNYTQELNPYTYRNYYNGAGIGIGDLDNDGLDDIYFTGNQVDNKLYRNKGDLQFELIESEILKCAGSWSTGVSIVDINADGLKDIYVCKAGPPSGPNRSNQLFINKGNFQFEERAADYGLDVMGFSIHASFFDFDRDGDLDCYLLNNSIRSVGGYDLREGLREVSSDQGNKLLVNENGIFVDKSDELGIYTSEIGFGLGVITSDLNSDGWIDIYVANDFFERDYYYINQEGLRFEEVGEEYFSSFSLGSMGADAADIDNDGDQDILVVEMAPQSLERKKTKATYDSWDKYQRAVKSGYFHQFPRNMLHLNEQDYFKDVSRAKGLQATEWSWAPLIFDMNNDGLKDIFISNGIGKDLLDRDYLAFMANEQNVGKLIKDNAQSGLKQLIDIMPKSPVNNAYFLQLSNGEFEEQKKLIDRLPATISNAAGISDLDNDGDFDLIISNVNSVVNVLENNSEEPGKIIKLKKGNSDALVIGATVTVYSGSQKVVELINPYRGFQSTVTTDILFTKSDFIDSIHVLWPTGQIEMFSDDLESNMIELVFGLGREIQSLDKKLGKKQLTILELDSITYSYSQRQFNEFNKEKLLLQMSPTVDPLYIYDQKDNVMMIGAPQNQSLKIYDLDQNSLIGDQADFQTSFRAHTSDMMFIDYDNDGDQDVYVAHGSRVFSQYSAELNDVIYENLGNNRYLKRPDLISFPKAMLTGAVASGDLNEDGYDDIVLTDQFTDDIYGESSTVYYYQNVAGEKFELVSTYSQADFGVSQSVEIADLDKNGDLDIVVTGEWMGIEVLNLRDGTLVKRTESFALNSYRGFWRDIHIIDIDHDGDLDIIGANQGVNSVYNSDHKMFLNDFDKNGRREQVISQKIDSKDYPILDYDELVAQIPVIRKAFRFYKDYAKASMNELFSEDILSSSIVYGLDELRSGLFLNENGIFRFIPFPDAVQHSSMHAIETGDINHDGSIDILIGGNHYLYKPQFGRDDASQGHVILGNNESGDYRFSDCFNMGIKGQIRNITQIAEDEYLIGVSGENIKKYKINYDE